MPYSRILPLLIAVAMSVGVAACRTAVPPPPQPPPVAPEPKAERPHGPMQFTATAYSIEGRTASGTRSREGIVAADPKVLPLGSRVRVSSAGQYDGEYVVTDTGGKIDGHDLDIYIANDAEAKRFGRKTVSVEVLQYGDGKRAANN